MSLYAMLSKSIAAINCRVLNTTYFPRRIQTSATLNALFPKVRNEQKYRKMDRMDFEYELIHTLTWPRCVQFAHHATSVSALSLPIMAYIWLRDEIDMLRESRPTGVELYDMIASENSDFYAYYAMFFFFTVTCRYATSHSPLRIYRSRDDYVALFAGNLPFIKKKRNFKAGDVVEYFNAWGPLKEATYKINKFRVFMFPQHFKRYSHLHRMLTAEQRKKYSNSTQL